MASSYLSNSKSGCGSLCLDNSTTLPDGSAFFAPLDTSHIGLGLKRIKMPHYHLFIFVKKFDVCYKNYMRSCNHIVTTLYCLLWWIEEFSDRMETDYLLPLCSVKTLSGNWDHLHECVYSTMQKC